MDDNEEYVKKHLEGEGFVLVAQAESGEIAGFFLVKKPEPEENLGTFLEFDGEQLSRVMIMDTAAVAAKYRGNGLQSRLCRAAVECIDSRKYQYLLCTIHPDNCYSLRNMQENGFAVQKAVKCYGGLDRYILMRELSPEK